LTDIHPGNILLGASDNSMFKDLEAVEFSNPAPRKELPDRIIYASRLMKPKVGPLLISDFGEARLGRGPHAGDIMPLMYRAPETLLHIQWSYPVDIWSVGLTVSSVPARNDWIASPLPVLIGIRPGTFSKQNRFSPPRRMIAALGPPPVELLERHKERALEYWDENCMSSSPWLIRNDVDSAITGKWGDFVPIPSQRTLENTETKLKDNVKFLRFIRRALAWDPDHRPTAKELLQDPWLQ
jgi:serine/threonine-protein kinase SRPK3